MNVQQLTPYDVEAYKSQIILLLRHAYEASFPQMTFEDSLLLNKVEELKSYLEKEQAFCAGVIDNGCLVSFIWACSIVRVVEKRLHILQLAVAPEYRRRGLARQLLYAADCYAQQIGCTSVDLLVSAAAKNSVEFYRQNEFQVERLQLKKTIV